MDMGNFQLCDLDVAMRPEVHVQCLYLSNIHDSYVVSDKCSDPCVWFAILSKFLCLNVSPTLPIRLT